MCFYWVESNFRFIMISLSGYIFIYIDHENIANFSKEFDREQAEHFNENDFEHATSKLTPDWNHEIYMLLSWFSISTSQITLRCVKRKICSTFHKPLWPSDVFGIILTVAGISLIFKITMLELCVFKRVN